VGDLTRKIQAKPTEFSGLTIQESYDRWSETYDLVNNRTRDLDEELTLSSKRYFKGKKVVELGCGTGKNTAIICQWASWVYALDFSDKMLTRAKKRLPTDAKVQFIRTDIKRKWPLECETADILLCSLVLEHIENLPHIFDEAFRVLDKKGVFWIRELHPFKQYLGSRACFVEDDQKTEIAAFVHHISDFLQAGKGAGFHLLELTEHWHEDERDQPPRLLSLLFEK